MDSTAQRYQRAYNHLQQGQLEQARSLCRDVVRTDPAHADAWHLLGFIALQRGETVEAIELIGRSVNINPRQPAAYLNLANALLRQGEFARALDSCDRALALRPDYVEARNNKSNALLRLNRPGEALEEIERALQLNPQHATLHNNRGNALRDLGRPEEALASYERAAQLSPADAEIAHNLAWAHGHRGRVLYKLRRMGEALESFQRALELDPAFVEALSGASSALRELRRYAEALEAADRCLSLDPRSLEALSNRARVLLALQRLQEAAEGFARLLQVAPEGGAQYNYTLGMLLHARLSCCDWRDYQSIAAAVEAGVRAGKRVTLPSLLLATCDSPELHLRCARLFVESNWARIVPAAWSAPNHQQQKIRLAYVSADFRDHPVAQLMAQLWETHDRERFETFAISLRPADDSALGRRVRDAFHEFMDVSAASDDEVCALLRKREIDIAVDLGGYTDGFRAGIFARRAAPVQVNYLGYPGTLAAAYYDYLIADETIIPPADRSFYTEKIVYLPDCYQPNGDRRTQPLERLGSRADHGLPPSAFVFCCFNTPHKILPESFRLWMRLLRRIEGSVLWLSDRGDAVARNLRSEAHNHGIAPGRLVFAPRLSDLREHLSRYALADLFLDTLPFNAHTTASDALAAGLPVLTCMGKAFAGRVAASLLCAAGLPELVTSTLEEYESLAQRLATEPARLAELRARLARNRQTHPVFDPERFRGHLESAYVSMWQRSKQGEAPASFAVPPLP